MNMEHEKSYLFDSLSLSISLNHMRSVNDYI